MTYGTNVSDQTIKNDIRTYDNIRKIATYKGDNYTTSCLLDFVYFKINHRMIVIDLSKQHVFDANQKAFQQITLREIYIEQETPQIFSPLKKWKKKSYIFSKEYWEYCKFILLWYNINIKWHNTIL